MDDSECADGFCQRNWDEGAVYKGYCDCTGCEQKMDPYLIDLPPYRPFPKQF